MSCSARALGYRIQRPRRKGAPLPEGAIYVGRGSMWANPFANRQWGHAKSALLFRRWIRGLLGPLSLARLGFSDGEIAALDRWLIRIRTRMHELAGQVLACWCALGSKWCHADDYLELAPIYAEINMCAL